MDVGDRVRIMNNVDETRYRRHIIGWNDDMLAEVGQVGTIIDYCPEGIEGFCSEDEEGDRDPTFVVKHDSGHVYYWFPENLETVI